MCDGGGAATLGDEAGGGGSREEDDDDEAEEGEGGAAGWCGTWLYTQPQSRGGQRKESPAIVNAVRMLAFQQKAASQSMAAAAEGNGRVTSICAQKKWKRSIGCLREL